MIQGKYITTPSFTPVFFLNRIIQIWINQILLVERKIYCKLGLKIQAPVDKNQWH